MHSRSMITRALTAAIVVTLAYPFVAGATHFWQQAQTGNDMTAAARRLLSALEEDDKATCQMEYESPKRVDWHFIPKDKRKGLQIKNMNPGQRQRALALLKAGLSEIGYKKATQIMELESLLAELEKGRSGGPVRDSERYYFTIFGEPDRSNRWGLSIEGHHLSLNFVVDQNKVISSTPAFFAANPGEVKGKGYGKIKTGTRVLALEETLAFELVNSLTATQKETAIIAKKAPREIRAAGAAQPPRDKPAGISAKDLEEKQLAILQKLVGEYVKSFPADIVRPRIRGIYENGVDKVHFAWAGAQKPGIGHYYRIQGPTFLIEFVNTQPDAAGNPANHIHCVWRDMNGDFAIKFPAKK